VTSLGTHGPTQGSLDEAVARLLIGRLGRVPHLHDRAQVLAVSPPETGSAADTELAERPEVKLGYIKARALLVCAIDHLETLRLLVVEARAVPSFAHMTLLRGALEPALQARWAMAGTTDDRVARGFALELENLDERRKFEECVDDGSLARGRIVQLLEKAEGIGLTSLNKRGERCLTKPAIGYIDLLRILPSADPSMTKSSDDSWVYRFLSGYAHAKTWATTLGAEPVPPTAGRDHVIVCRVEAVDVYLVKMVERVMSVVEAAVSEVEALWGLPAEQHSA